MKILRTLALILLLPLAVCAASYKLDEPVLDENIMAALVRDKIKYVFVIFNENESFDHMFGTFPGANGLYADANGRRSAADIARMTQVYKDINGVSVRVQPFRLGPQQNATFMDGVDHSHTGLAAKLDVVAGRPMMDGFSADEYARYARFRDISPAAAAQAGQFAHLVMSHVDCDTIPFFWLYASRFTLFDNIFATEDTPSTPNAIAMIAGQAGESQWVKHGGAVPLVKDPQPFWGSVYDPTAENRQPTAPREDWRRGNIAENLDFATVMLTLAGYDVGKRILGDRALASDTQDIARDIPYIMRRGGSAFDWRWYQNGYDVEPNEPAFAPKDAHANYVSHHNGVQYFGYLANNDVERPKVRGEGDFFKDLTGRDLPANGGVIYIRGGYYNIAGQKPPIQNVHYPNPAGLTAEEIKTIVAAKSGDDDHPGYSDHQLTETMMARVINAIASDPKLWSQSAIIITYDESDGFYDHVAPRILSYGPDGLPLARGIRIPLILISPFARAGAVSHAEGDHNAVIETINAIFRLPPLSSLPDEAEALKAGNAPRFNALGPPGFAQKWLGPRDMHTPITDSLLSGFSPARLQGKAPPLPADYAKIPERDVFSLPHFAGRGCERLHIRPTDADVPTPPPNHFNTLPATLPAYN